MSRYSDRYDDREGPAKLYVGRLSSRTRSRDLEDLFRRYGRIREVNVKHDFAFIEFSDPRDADDAKNCLNNKVVDGSRIIVEFAKRGLRGPDGGREYVGRGPPPGTGKCYNCGNEGHWARDCKSGDRNDKFYRCGRRGHIEKKCHNSPRPSSRYNRHVSHSRSPSRDRHTSRSPIENHRYSRSPKRVIRSPLNENRARSLSPSPGHKESQSHFPSPVVNHNLNALPRRRESGISRSITPLSGAENGK